MLQADGFQEGWMDSDYAARDVEDIEKLVKLAENKRFEDRKIGD
jgi:hypothetical protein